MRLRRVQDDFAGRLRANGRIQFMAASRKVQGSRSPGQGCVIDGTGEIVTAGEHLELVREKFPWAG